MNEKGLSPGDILKKIRKELGFKQHEIAGDDITRNLISLIENNRASLNRGNAEILVRNINNLCRMKGIDLELEFKDLFISGIYDAKSKAITYTEFLKDVIRERKVIKESDINEISVFLSKWDLLPQNSLLFSLIGDYYRTLNKCNKAYFYYIKAFENVVKIKNDNSMLVSLCKKAVDCGFKLGRLSECLEFLDITEAHLPSTDFENLSQIWFQKATIKLKLKDYDSAFKEIESIETHIEGEDFLRYIDLEILKYTLYKETGNQRKAVDILKSLKSKIPETDIDMNLLINSYFLDIYYPKKNIPKLKIYLKYFEEKIDELEDSSPYDIQILRSAAFGYLNMKKIESAREYLSMAFIRSVSISDYISFRNIAYEIIDSSSSEFCEELKNMLVFSFRNSMPEMEDSLVIDSLNYFKEMGKTEFILEVLSNKRSAK